MTDRWKIVLLIIVVVIALFFAFFLGLILGQPETNKSEALKEPETTVSTTPTSSNDKILQSDKNTEQVENETNNNTTSNLVESPGQPADRPKNQDPSNNGQENGEKASSQATISNPYIEETLANYLADQKKRRAIKSSYKEQNLSLEDKNSNKSNDAAQKPDGEPLYTISSLREIKDANVGILMKQLNAVGLQPYLVETPSMEKRMSMMRIGYYKSRLEAELDLPKIPKTAQTSFIILRVASRTEIKNTIALKNEACRQTEVLLMDIVFVTNSLNVFSAGLFTLVLILAAVSLVVIKKNEKIRKEDQLKLSILLDEKIAKVLKLQENNFLVLNQTSQTIAAHCRREAETREKIHDIVIEVREELVNQNLSKMKVDDALKSILNVDVGK